MTERTYRVRTPLFPTYSEVRHLLPVIDNRPKSSVIGLINAIWEQTGTPQAPVSWSDPDTWIAQRLSGEDAQLAQRIWEASGRTLNPRHFYGAYSFINIHGLSVSDSMGLYRSTERGKAFLDDNSRVIRELDDTEGLPQLLAILSTKTQAKRSDLLPEWGDYLREHSKFGTLSTIKDTLRRRLVNLVERGMVAREGIAYVITQKGRDYAATFTGIDDDPKRKVIHTINAYNDRQREALRQQLSTMHPYQFEHLIRELLEAMGYEDVSVTKESGDKGVDVVATAQFGITTIREVIQVKRHQSSIGRPVLDQLRGALPYHKAIRGTLITLGNFSKGCAEAALYPGAAPIGLINGDKLLEMLIEHKIGILKRPILLYELDQDFLAAFAERAAVEEMVES
jgi:restriction system protein